MEVIYICVRYQQFPHHTLHSSAQILVCIAITVTYLKLEFPFIYGGFGN